MLQTKLLSHYDGSRHNNFTSIRFLLAWMVIFAHSFVLQPAPGVHMPLGFLLQNSTTTGQMAVDGFFAISGFLVAGSLVKRGLLDYSLSRLLRVLPGLIVCVFTTVLLLGPLVSSMPATDYFSSSASYRYLSNSLAFPSTVYNLPGVFDENSRTEVNGSLWSIRYEVRCYVVLGIAGLLGLLRFRKIANSVLTVVAAVFFLSYIKPDFVDMLPHVSSALLSFVIGVFIFCNRDKFVLDARLALAALVVLYLSFGELWFRYTYPFVWAYALFYFAYRTPFLNVDGKIGDCSYGIYIYAFPVQQLVASLMPSGTPYTNMLITTAVVVPLALFSWRVIENPALGLKGKYLKGA